jgi:hypothetical protein
MMAFGRDQLRTVVKLALVGACVTMITLWPEWRVELRTQGYYKPGRITGGGGCTVNGVHVTHGFELYCKASQGPNNLEVNWTIEGQTGSHRFHLEDLATAVCTDDPTLDEEQPVAGFDTYTGTGTGRYNGTFDAFATWTLTDDGEPGTGADTFDITITVDGGPTVLDISCPLDGGNHQAHRGK